VLHYQLLTFRKKPKSRKQEKSEASHHHHRFPPTLGTMKKDPSSTPTPPKDSSVQKQQGQDVVQDDAAPATTDNSNQTDEVTGIQTTSSSSPTGNINKKKNKKKNMVPPEPMPNDEEDDQDKLSTKETDGDDSPAVEEAPPKSHDDRGEDDLEAQPGDDESTGNHDGDGLVKEDANKKTKKSKKKNKPEMNPRFKDVQETGKWGEMGKNEFYIAVAVFLVIIIVVVVVVVVVVQPNNQVEYVPAPTLAPTEPATKMPPLAELTMVRAQLEDNTVTAPLVNDDDLPDDPAFYEGLVEDTAATPQQKAMSWLLYQDQFGDPDQSTLRWALVSIYFQLGGPEWTSSEGWLSPTDHVCEWERIDCDALDRLRELDLDENNLVGAIGLEFALLGDNIQSILMKRNKLQGPIPPVFQALPSLGMLYLDNNSLTGSVPYESLGSLHTLYVHFNQLTGNWPLEFCSQDSNLNEFGLDCDKLSCPPECCTPLECYYSS